MPRARHRVATRTQSHAPVSPWMIAALLLGLSSLAGLYSLSSNHSLDLILPPRLAQPQAAPQAPDSGSAARTGGPGTGGQDRPAGRRTGETRTPPTPDTDPASRATTACATLDETAKVPGEYFEYYTIPAEEQMTPYYETGSLAAFDQNMWYAMGEFNSPIWAEYPDNPPHVDSGFWKNPLAWAQEWAQIGPQQYTTPVKMLGRVIPQAPAVAGLFYGDKVKRPVLTGLRLGDRFTYTGQAWPGHGSRHDGDIERNPGAAFGHAFYKVEEVPQSITCRGYFFVYEYDPTVISIDKVSGVGLAWWKDGQIAMYTPTIKFCGEHCEPSDSYPNPVARFSGHLLKDPGVSDYRPLRLTVINRGLSLAMPESLNGNGANITDSYIEDSHGWRWQMQKALRIHASETNPHGIAAAAKVPSSGDIIAALTPAFEKYVSLTGLQLFLGRGTGAGSAPTNGYVYDASSKSTYFLNDQYAWLWERGQRLQVSQTEIEVPVRHLIAQNAGTEKFMQGIVGFGFAHRFWLYVDKADSNWPQAMGVDFATKPHLFPPATEKGYGLTASTCEVQPLRTLRADGSGISPNGYLQSRGAASLVWDTIVDGQLPALKGYLIIGSSFHEANNYFNFLLSLYDGVADEPGVDVIRAAVLQNMKTRCDAMLQRNALDMRPLP